MPHTHKLMSFGSEHSPVLKYRRNRHNDVPVLLHHLKQQRYVKPQLLLRLIIRFQVRAVLFVDHPVCWALRIPESPAVRHDMPSVDAYYSTAIVSQDERWDRVYASSIFRNNSGVIYPLPHVLRPANGGQISPGPALHLGLIVCQPEVPERRIGTL